MNRNEIFHAAGRPKHPAGAALKVTGLQRPTTTPLREITPEPFPYGMRRAAGAFIRSLESLVKGPRSVMTYNGQFNTNTDLFF